jgi:hypothetical protein
MWGHYIIMHKVKTSHLGTFMKILKEAVLYVVWFYIQVNVVLRTAA